MPNPEVPADGEGTVPQLPELELWRPTVTVLTGRPERADIANGNALIGWRPGWLVLALGASGR